MRDASRQTRPRERRLTAVLVVVVAALSTAAGASAQSLGQTTAPEPAAQPSPASPWDQIVWRRSKAIGKPWRGRLVRGVKLPAYGPDWFTWDWGLQTRPNRIWRRYGHDRLVRMLVGVLAQYRAAHPEAPRVGIADISRPKGGRFGRRYGGLGHASHQSGLDADLLYPRLDRQEIRPERVSQIDHYPAQDLVSRLVKANAQKVFVGPRTELRGKRGVVSALVGHDDHLHVRIRPRKGGR